mgnify:CR=1 FL=1
MSWKQQGFRQPVVPLGASHLNNEGFTMLNHTCFGGGRCAGWEHSPRVDSHQTLAFLFSDIQQLEAILHSMIVGTRGNCRTASVAS